jgi:hypothetical protein
VIVDLGTAGSSRRRCRWLICGAISPGIAIATDELFGERPGCPRRPPPAQRCGPFHPKPPMRGRPHAGMVTAMIRRFRDEIGALACNRHGRRQGPPRNARSTLRDDDLTVWAEGRTS